MPADPPRYPDPPRPLIRRSAGIESSSFLEDALAAYVVQMWPVLDRFVRDDQFPGDRLARRELAARLHPGYQLDFDGRVISTGVVDGRCYLHRLPIEHRAGVRIHGLSRRLQFFREPGTEGGDETRDGVSSAHRSRSESLGSALLALIEARGMDRTPVVDADNLATVVHRALSDHVVGDNINAARLTFPGMDRIAMERAAAALRSPANRWREHDVPFVLHLAACSHVGDNFVLPSGTRIPIPVDERVGRFGDCDAGPYLVLAARVIEQLDSNGFAAAYAVPLTSLLRALICESNPEGAVQAVMDDEVCRINRGQAPSFFWVQKLLFGRGRPYEALEIDRLDHRLGAGTWFVDYETAGSHDPVYVSGKVEVVTRSAMSRPVVVIDWAWAGRSQPRRDRILLELRLQVRRLLLAWKNGSTVSSGLLAVIPQEGPFFEKLHSLPAARVEMCAARVVPNRA